MSIPNTRPPQIVPPMPSDPLTASRWDQTRLRRRMLEGDWQDDLKDRYLLALGQVRARAHGELDYSANPFRVICQELSVLYDRSPHVRHEDRTTQTEAFLGRNGPISRAQLWPLMARTQPFIIGCREYFLRVTAYEDGSLTYRPVAPDMVMAAPDHERPDQPVYIEEIRLRKVEGHGMVWTLDCLSIEDPTYPYYRVFVTEGGTKKGADITEQVLGGRFEGESYPYYREGAPVLPYVLYHAQKNGDRLFDPYAGREIVEGSLNLAVGYSFFWHCLRDASWPQRWVANGRPAGLAATDTDAGRRLEITTDPATLLILESSGDGLESSPMQVTAGQFSSPMDLEKLERSLSSYGQRLAQDAGLPASDIQRLGGNARSGYAIALTSEGRREAQRKYAPLQAASDQELIGLSAALLNGATGSTLPESGYVVSYAAIPLSPDELRERRAHIVQLIQAGLMDRVQGYMELHPGLTEQEAAAELARIDRDRAFQNTLTR